MSTPPGGQAGSSAPGIAQPGTAAPGAGAHSGEVTRAEVRTAGLSGAEAPGAEARGAGSRGAESRGADVTDGGVSSGGVLSADVLVIGAGVIGLSIAWRAAQLGLSVLVADGDPGRGASHAAAGMLTPVSEAAYAEKELFRLGSQSLDSYPGFAAELTELTGRPTGFRQGGTLQVGYDPSDMAVLDELRELQETFGRPSARLTARECRAAEPMLDPSVRGGLLTEADGSVDPRLLAGALLAAAQAAGAVLVRQYTAELTTTPAGGRQVAGARLADGTTVTAGQVVLAAGWRSGQIGGLPADAVPPVRPVKGQILRLRTGQAVAGQPPGLLARTVRGVVRGSTVYLVPRLDGELVIGATQEELGADTRVTAGGVWELLRDARTLVPGITELELAEAAAGLRPGTPDNAPLIGPSSLAGLVLATGHFRSGVLLAPVTASIVAGYLATGQLAAIAEPFSAQRFTTRPAAPRPASAPARAAGHDGPEPLRWT